MPVTCPIRFARLTEDEMRVLDREIMGHAFATHTALGRLCDESITEFAQDGPMTSDSLDLGQEDLRQKDSSGNLAVPNLSVLRPHLLCVMAALLTVCAHAAPVTALAFAPDGTALVSNGDRRLDVRSVKDAAFHRSIVCELPKITGIAFAPHGRLLAVAGGEPGVRGELRLLSWPDGRELHRLDGPADLFTSIAFNHDGTRFGAASAGHTALIWNFDGAAAPAVLFTLTGHAAPVLAIAFSPSGKTIATAGADRALKIWSAVDGGLLRSLGYHTEAIHAIAFRPGAADVPVTCATAADDRTVRIWQPEIGRMVRIIRGHEGSVFALAWSADGSTLFTAGREGILRHLDGGSDTILSRQAISTDWIYSLALSPDGTTLATGDWSGTVRLYSATALKSQSQPGKESP